jgi:hypothetical protein
MDMNPETIQQRIQIARRDAEALKDRIKRKKDELADTTRELSPSLLSLLQLQDYYIACACPACSTAIIRLVHHANFVSTYQSAKSLAHESNPLLDLE